MCVHCTVLELCILVYFLLQKALKGFFSATFSVAGGRTVLIIDMLLYVL